MEAAGLADYPDLRFTALVLLTELVTNSVRHAGLEPGSEIGLSIACDDAVLRVEVLDDGPGFDPLALFTEQRRREQRHRGIFFVDALADRWGYRRDPGCVMWFEIDLVPGRRPWRGRVAIPTRSGTP